MFEETLKLPSPTGAMLAYHHEPADGTARGVIVVLHGLAEHSKRYAMFAKTMSMAGYHVYAHDHRGHGETTAPDAPRGQFARRSGEIQVISDVLAMRNLAATAHPHLPLILFGHSMGGLICFNTAIAHPSAFDAIAVWNSNCRADFSTGAARVILKIERMLKGSDVPSTWLPRLTFEAWGRSVPRHRTLLDWLSRDPAAVDAYIADPLCGFDACVSLWLDILAMMFRASWPDCIRTLPHGLPIHLVGGGADPATDNGKAVAWLANRLKAAGFSNISCTIHREMRHETLHEIGADDALASFGQWCDRITARGSLPGNGPK